MYFDRVWCSLAKAPIQTLVGQGRGTSLGGEGECPHHALRGAATSGLVMPQSAARKTLC